METNSLDTATITAITATKVPTAVGTLEVEWKAGALILGGVTTWQQVASVMARLTAPATGAAPAKAAPAPAAPMPEHAHAPAPVAAPAPLAAVPERPPATPPPAPKVAASTVDADIAAALATVDMDPVLAPVPVAPQGQAPAQGGGGAGTKVAPEIAVFARLNLLGEIVDEAMRQGHATNYESLLAFLTMLVDTDACYAVSKISKAGKLAERLKWHCVSKGIEGAL